MKITQDTFLDFKRFTTKETSTDPENWTAVNPLCGHCAVVSLLAQDYFGGELVRGSLEDFPEYAYLSSCYWNKLQDGKEVDFAAEQFTKRPDFIQIVTGWLFFNPTKKLVNGTRLR